MIEATVTIPGETRSRVTFSDAAVELVDRLWAQHGPVMFHQSGGCCDGSSPMCFPLGDFLTSDRDILLGVVELDADRPIEFWMSREQFEYWSHTHLTIDVVPGRGSGFSLEGPEGVRFLLRSRLMDSARPFE